MCSHVKSALRSVGVAGRPGPWRILAGVFGLIIIAATARVAVASSVTLWWTAPGDDGTIGRAAQYDLRYSTSPISESNWAQATQVSGEPTPSPVGSAESFSISGLAPNTTYYFAIKTADEVPNWSVLSNNVRVSTDNVPPAAIDDLVAFSGENRGELTLRWTATGDDGEIGSASYYLIAYDTDTITVANWTQASVWLSPPDPLPAGQVQTFTLTGLQPGLEYWVVIQVFDDAGNGSALSNIAHGVAKFTIISDVTDESGDAPAEFRVSQNYPNPFNPSTMIAYSVPSTDRVAVTVYNILGQRIRALVDEIQSPGTYAVEWDGTDSFGRRVASGTYLYLIQAGRFSTSKKMTLLR